jgi:cytochrome c peroxidase
MSLKILTLTWSEKDKLKEKIVKTSGQNKAAVLQMLKAVEQKWNLVFFTKLLVIVAMVSVAVLVGSPLSQAQSDDAERSVGKSENGKRLFEREEFGGNGRTCLTCHSRETGTVSPEDAQRRFVKNPKDPLFLHDGSDDRLGNGVMRMLADATILVEVPLPPNVRLADDPYARSVILRRGIPSTLNTPALDPVLMLDGRHPDLEAQALGAIRDHFQNTVDPTYRDLQRIAEFQQTHSFFSSHELKKFARGGPAPELPQGYTESEKRGRVFFEDGPFASPFQKAGACAACHSGPMLNESSRFFPLLPPGTRFQTILVSEFNAAGNPARDFIFTNPDGSETIVRSPDPGRSLITGDAGSPFFDSVNAFKIPSLWGVSHTAPYFHDNSAKTLEDVVSHYARFFEVASNGELRLSEQDNADIVAYLKLLN